MNEYKTLSKEPWVNIEVSGDVPGHIGVGQLTICPPQLADENVREWKIGLIVLNPDSLYYGGYFMVSPDGLT